MQTNSRWILTALTLVALSACKQSDQPAASRSADSATAAAPSISPAAESLSMMASNPKVGNWKGVGTKQDGMLVTNGTAGYLMFGPYANLKAGTYNVEVKGAIRSIGTGQKVVFDAVSNKGSKRLGVLDVTAVPQSGDVIAAFPITLPEDVKDLEIRANVPTDADLSISGYTVTK